MNNDRPLPPQGEHQQPVYTLSKTLSTNNNASKYGDLQQALLRYVLKGNYLAPIMNPTHILDISTGTDCWAIEMAHEFPQAQLIGFDLTPVANHTMEHPSNCHFQNGTILQGLPFAENTFDFVHQHLLIFTIPQTYWQQAIQELARVTHQGGWVELVEMNPFFEHVGPAMQQLLDIIIQGAYQQGFEPAIGQHLQTHLKTARLKHRGTSTQLIPLGAWGGQLGKMAFNTILAFLQAMKASIINQELATEALYEQLMLQIEAEAERHHTTFTCHIAYGQRH